MVSKYDLQWKRVRSGHYILSPNGNYEIIKRKDGWEILYFDLMRGRKVIEAQRIPTYAKAKDVCMRILNKRMDDAMSKLGRRR